MKKYISLVLLLFFVGCVSCPVEMISRIDNLSTERIVVNTSDISQVVKSNSVYIVKGDDFVLLANYTQFKIDILSYEPSEITWGFFSKSTLGYYKIVVFEFEYTEDGKLYILNKDGQRIVIPAFSPSCDSN